LRHYLEKTQHKKGLVEWLKQKAPAYQEEALNSNPSTIKETNKQKKAGRVVQVVQHLLSKHEALSTATKINK
jgi:arsenate reductase-like glutaredoxin family protein